MVLDRCCKVFPSFWLRSNKLYLDQEEKTNTAQIHASILNDAIHLLDNLAVIVDAALLTYVDVMFDILTLSEK